MSVFVYLGDLGHAGESVLTAGFGGGGVGGLGRAAAAHPLEGLDSKVSHVDVTGSQ